MRALLLILAFSATRAFGLDAEVGALKAAMQTGDAGTINSALVRLQIAVNSYEVDDSSAYNNPSPARQQSLNEIKTALAPVKSDLVQIAASPDPSNAGGAINILGYTDGGSEVQQTLATTLGHTSNADLASKAFTSLNRLGEADPDVLATAAQRISAYDPSDNSGDSVGLGLLHDAAFNPIPEALDAYIKLLNSNSIAAKVLAASAIMALGPAGEKALPDLETQVAFLKQSNADQRYINTLERAVRVVKGEAKTGIEAPNAPETNANSAPSNTQSEQPAVNTPRSKPTPLAQEVPSDGWGTTVILVVVGLAVVLAGYLFIRRRE